MPRRSVKLRFTVDNPCGGRLRVRARESPQRTLTLEWIEDRDALRICPGLVNLQTYTATLTALRIGEWRVKASTMMRDTIPGFAIQ